jgi:hypothetical protein
MTGRLRGNAAPAAVLLLVLVGFALRWRGVGWGLPHQTYRDGMVISTQVDLLRSGAEDPGRHEFWGYYPHLLSRIVALLPGATTQPKDEPLPLAQHLARASEPWLWARKVSVLLSLLAIPGAYWIARRFVEAPWAVFAGALVAFSMLHLSFAQQEKPHGPVSGTVAVAIAAALWLRRSPGWGSFALAALAAVVAACTLQNGAAAWLAFEAACFLAFLEARSRGRVPVFLTRVGAFATLAALAAAVVFFYPFHFDRFHEEAVGKSAVSLGGHPLMLDKLDFVGARNMLVTLYLYEPVLLALALAAGVVYAARRARRVAVDRDRKADFLVVAAFAVPYGFVLCLYHDAFDRFLMPLLPVLAALAAYGASAIAARLRAPAIRAALAGALLVEPAAASWKLAEVRAEPDTQARVARWIQDNARPEDRIFVLPYVDLPLFYASASRIDEDGDTADIEESPVLTWMAYQARLSPACKQGPAFALIPPGPVKRELEELGDDPLAALERRGADYVVIQAFGERYRYKVLLKLLEDLRSRAERVFVASPRTDERESGRVWIRERMTFLQVPTWIRIFGTRSVGTTLEVYRMPRRAEVER